MAVWLRGARRDRIDASGISSAPRRFRYHDQVQPIVRALAADVGALGAMLARAFFDDPVARWLFPEADRRLGALESFFAVQLRHGYLPRGVVLATEDRRSCAMWVASWSDPLGVVDRFAHLRVGWLLRGRAPVARALTRSLAAFHPDEPHLYLGTIGTDPDHRRLGYASALLEQLTDDADRRAVGAYLECSCEHNVALYRRMGFEVREEVEPIGRGPRLWLMWRPATPVRH